MKMTSFNVRTCIVTKQKKRKEELIKISKKDDEWQITDDVYVGRSIYISKDKEILEKVVSKKKFKYRDFKLNSDLKSELEKIAQNI